MNHIRIYRINYHILFRHQSGRRQSYEFDSAVKRLVRMSRIFFVFLFLGHFQFFRGGVVWGGIGLEYHVFIVILSYYYILYYIIIYYIILYHILYHIIMYYTI